MDEDFCWVCRICWKESQFQRAGTETIPDNFVDHPEKGVICLECSPKSKSVVE